MEGLIGVSTSKKNGLLEAGKFGKSNVMDSILLIQSNSSSYYTSSFLISISKISGGPASLYYISINRETGAKDKVSVKVISGSYNNTIVYKKLPDGNVAIYAKRTGTTPVISGIMLCNKGTTNLIMSRVADESELDDSIEAELL